jgi:arginase
MLAETHRSIDLIGVPMDFGAGHRGVDLGPAAIRHARLVARLRELGHEVQDRGDIAVPVHDNAEVGDPSLRYLDSIVPVLTELGARVQEATAAGRIPVVLGGDHSIGLGSVAGSTAVKKLGVLWVDTHGDFNTHETTPSGNIHGMPLAALCGYGDDVLCTLRGTHGAPIVDPANVVVVGARDLDHAEKRLMREAGVTVFSMAAIDRYGIHEVMRRAMGIAAKGTDGIHLTFDLDVVDPQFAPGVGTPSPGGMPIREAHVVMEMMAASGLLVALDVVEVNPVLDERNRTAELAVDLILSALGKTIWYDDGLLQLSGFQRP